jgi:hypothetical protein
MFLDGNHMATHFELYVKTLRLPVWTSVKVEHTHYDSQRRMWDVRIRDAQDGSKVGHVRSKYVVWAIGGGGQIPFFPTIPNQVRTRVSDSRISPFLWNRGIFLGCLQRRSDPLRSVHELWQVEREACHYRWVCQHR